jgi:hypothetical protein
MSIILSGDISESEYITYQKLDNLRKLLREYLSMASCDGKTERKELRKQLANMLNEKYDEKNCRIIQ